MFKIIPIQKAYQNKFARQKQTDGLEISQDGLCAHTGKISPGCFWCLSSTALSYGVNVGTDVGLPNICNLNCPYCFMHSKHLIVRNNTNVVPDNWHLDMEFLDKVNVNLQRINSLSEDHEFISFSFTGDGAETLLYMPVIRAYMKFYKERIEPSINRHAWYKIYTNGILASQDIVSELKDLGITEMRFHIGASDFSNTVIKRISKAVRIIHTVSIETPAWPPHRKKLFQSLPVFNDIGIKHLNLIEAAITQWNINSIMNSYPEAEVYHSHSGLAIDDGGLVYDLMERTISKNYNFSVLDCHTLIRKIRDEHTYNQYFRGALKSIGYGKDWCDIGISPE
jgi:pyruvate formate-lyase activating enzyme-like uncharacterized protein